MGIRTEEVVEPRTALEKILSILAEGKKFDSAMAKRITRAANRGLIGNEDWAYVTEAEKVNPNLRKEQEALPLDDPKTIYKRKYANRPDPKKWWNEPPAGHPHAEIS